jgi:hypothetical protein
MTRLSEHDLWNSLHAVATLPPSGDDVFVVTTLNGQIASVQPINEYEVAVRTAQAFIRRILKPRRLTIKVLCLGLREAQRLGLVPNDLFAGQTQEQDAEDWQLLVTTLMDAMRASNEPQVRSDAYDTLRQIGAIP